MMARITVGVDEWVVDYEATESGRYVAPSTSGPEEFPDFELGEIRVAAINGRRRTVPWSKDEWFNRADKLIDRAAKWGGSVFLQLQCDYYEGAEA